MRYIVLDLEWNQSNKITNECNPDLPFEIIEIGALKMDEECRILGEFSEIVKPQVYHEMHQITSKLIHMQIQELERGDSFENVANRFLDWCGDEAYTFCTWGPLDLTELQRNMDFYHMNEIAYGPISFLDVQKLYALYNMEGKERRALEYAIDAMHIEKDIPFHRAFSDAYYTAKILKVLIKKDPQIVKNVSFDLYHPPMKREDEVKIRFDTYNKYISRVFKNKTEAFADREVSSSKCYICHRNLRKKVKWFTPNGKHYYCVAFCEQHGYLKAKIRIRKLPEDGGLFVVKTTKFISKEKVDELIKRKEHAAQVKRENKERLRAAQRKQKGNT